MERERRNGADAAFKERWPDIAERGFTAVPKCLTSCSGILGLKPREVVVLQCILDHYWYVNDDIFPTIDTLASGLGMGNSTVRDIIGRLKEKGFLDTRRRYSRSNLYNLSPLAKRLKEHLPSCPKYQSRIEKNSKHSQESSYTYRSKPDSANRQVPSDYIEALNLEESEVDSFTSQRFTNEDVDESLNRNVLGIPYIAKKNYPHKHGWEVVEEKELDNEDIVRYYICVWCPEMWHEKVDEDDYTSLDADLYDGEGVRDPR